jgi:hypothetical protein
MRTHGVARALRIAPLNGLKNPFVVILATLRAALDVIRAHSLFSKQPYDRVD